MTNGLMRPMDNSPESITRRMRDLLKRSGLTMEQMAKAMGYRYASSIQRYMNPDKLKPGYLKRDLVAKIERALLGKGSPPIQRPEIWELAGPEFVFAASTQKELTLVTDSPNAMVGPKVTPSRNKLPAYGQAVAGVDGEFIMNGSLVAYVEAPAGLDEDKGAYAVFVAGDSMEPRYYDGETVFVDPTRRPMRGDFVVAQILSKEGDPPYAYIKRFLRHNAQELVLSQFNPDKEMHFRADHVVSVHVIVMSGRPVGF